jgi:hypothetical protein
VADPWFKDFLDNEKVGCTVLCAAEERWIQLLNAMRDKGYIQFHKEVPLSEFIESQYWTVAKKKSFQKFLFLRGLIRVFRTSFYRKLFLTGDYRYWHYRRYMKLLRKYKRRLHA